MKNIFLTGKFAFLSFCCIPAILSSAVAQTNPSIAVMDFTGKNVSQTDAQSLTDRFRTELMQLNTYDVMEREQMQVILKEQAFQQTGCVDASCAIEAGQLIAVQKIITGSVAKVGGIYAINAKLLDVATGRIEQNVAEDCDCPIEQLLTVTMGRLAKKITGAAVEPSGTTVAIKGGNASVYVASNPADGAIYVDGVMADGRTPATIGSLAPGRHSIMVRKAQLTGQKDVSLVGNQVTKITIKLVKQTTVVKVTTEPPDVEIFIDRAPGPRVNPSFITPAMIKPGSRESLTFTAFKAGYRDTAMQVMVQPNQINEIRFSLTPADAAKIISQKQMVGVRTQWRTGKVMLWSAAASLVGAGAFYLLGQQDYSHATDAKNYLDKSLLNTPERQAKERENTDAAAAGNLKSTLSAGAAGLGGVLLGVGLILYF